MQDIFTDFNMIIGAYSKEIPVKSCMMQLAQGYPIGHNRFAFRFCIWDYVGGIKQLKMFQAT
jgi:hypothetical protein